MPSAVRVERHDVDSMLELSVAWISDRVDHPLLCLLEKGSSGFGSSDLVVVFAVIGAPVVHEAEWGVDGLRDTIGSGPDSFSCLQGWSIQAAVGQ